LKKIDSQEKIFVENERILLMILRENNKPELYNNLSIYLPKYEHNNLNIGTFIQEFSSLKTENKGTLYYSLYNFLSVIHFFNSNVYSDMKMCLEFILNMINLISNFIS
jgi:hypothetical protein